MRPLLYFIMRKNIVFTFLIVLIFQIMNNAQAKQDFPFTKEFPDTGHDVKKAEPEIRKLTVLPEIPQHPRLFLSKSEEKKLKKNIKKDELWNKLHTEIIREADRMIPLSVTERNVIGIRLLDTSRENLRRIFYLSYAYRMTNEKKYLRRAEAEMLSAASMTDWNPSHFLDVAEMTFALAIGYDWLYHDLTKENRTLIKEAIIAKGIERSYGKEFPLTAKNNWNQVCNSGITAGALAVMEDIPELTLKTINRLLDTMPVSMREYSPNGAYPEGIGYWYYGTVYNAIAIDLFENIFKTDFGLSEIDGFMASALYSQHGITPSGRVFCYADNTSQAKFNPAVFFFYKKTKVPALIYMQKMMLEQLISENDAQDSTNDIPEYLKERMLPLALVWGAGSGASFSNPTEPEQLCWMGRGTAPVAFMRSSWSDSNALYLGLKAGQADTGHGHIDAGTFYFEEGGVRWALDLGREEYHQVESVGVDFWNMKEGSQRWDVYRLNNFAHNTLTVNDRRHPVNAFAPITDFIDTPSNMSATTDLSALFVPWLTKVERTVSMIDKKRINVEDHFVTDRYFTKVCWTMMTEAVEATQTNDTQIILRKGDKKLLLEINAPVEFRFGFAPAVPNNVYDSPNSGINRLTFEFELPRNSTNTFEVSMKPL